MQERFDLSDLSSGEKQIVSLLQPPLLVREDSFTFVLIDEPGAFLVRAVATAIPGGYPQGRVCAGLVPRRTPLSIYDNELPAVRPLFGRVSRHLNGG